jgi:hypothetical protein
MNNPYTRLFLAIKIWKKGNAGDFGAAAVLWGKNDDGGIIVRKAIDFGTKALSTNSKTSYAVEGVELLPPVIEWSRPESRPSHDSLRSELESYTSSKQIRNLPMSKSWNLTLPAVDVLFKTSTEQSTDDTPYYLLENPTVHDCSMNLQVFLWHIKHFKF